MACWAAVVFALVTSLAGCASAYDGQTCSHATFQVNPGHSCLLPPACFLAGLGACSSTASRTPLLRHASSVLMPHTWCCTTLTAAAAQAAPFMRRPAPLTAFDGLLAPLWRALGGDAAANASAPGLQAAVTSYMRNHAIAPIAGIGALFCLVLLSLLALLLWYAAVSSG